MRRAVDAARRRPGVKAVASSSRFGGARSYDNYLRLLQNQVTTEGNLLLEASKQSEETGMAVVTEPKKPKFVSYNQLVAAPDAPKDPVMLFRDLDNLRQLSQMTGSSLTISDTDCSTLCMDLFQEVRRGRRLTKEITRIFDKIEAHPDFYQARTKAYNIMIFNSLATEYPQLQAPAAMYGNLLEKDGATWWTYLSLARVQLFLPPVERPEYQKAFTDEIAVLQQSGAISELQAQRARTFIKNLHWFTELPRLTLYAFGLLCSYFLFAYAYEKRRLGRHTRAEMEDEMFKALDEQVLSKHYFYQ